MYNSVRQEQWCRCHLQVFALCTCAHQRTHVDKSCWQRCPASSMQGARYVPQELLPHRLPPHQSRPDFFFDQVWNLERLHAETNSGKAIAPFTSSSKQQLQFQPSQTATPQRHTIHTIHVFHTTTVVRIRGDVYIRYRCGGAHLSSCALRSAACLLALPVLHIERWRTTWPSIEQHADQQP